MVAIFAMLPGDAFLDWGWRIPFLCSGLLIVVGLWVRAHLEETPQFRAVEEQHKQRAAPHRVTCCARRSARSSC